MKRYKITIRTKSHVFSFHQSINISRAIILSDAITEMEKMMETEKSNSLDGCSVSFIVEEV